MNKNFIDIVALLLVLLLFFIVKCSRTEKPNVNDTGKTVYDVPCIIFVKDYTKYNVKPEYVIPSYDPQGYMIDTCRGKMFY
jgi:hypothetical protein